MEHYALNLSISSYATETLPERHTPLVLQVPPVYSLSVALAHCNVLRRGTLVGARKFAGFGGRKGHN